MAKKQTNDNDAQKDKAVTEPAEFKPVTAVAEVDKLTHRQVFKNCKYYELPCTVPPSQARKLLKAALRGGQKTHVNGGTLCPVCKSITRVYSASDTQRYYVCDSCGHKFSRMR